MKLRIFLILMAFLLLLTGGELYFLFTPTVKYDQGVAFYLKPNSIKKNVFRELAEQHIIPASFFSSLSYSLQVFIPTAKTQLKTGEYLFPKGATPFSIWKQITQGKGLVYHPFTLVPGWSFVELREALLKTEGIKHSLKELTDEQVMKVLGSSHLLPEGLFFPETYYYTKGIPDLTILKRAFDLMQVKLKTAWLSRAADLPYQNTYEALIAASLIEKEAYLNTERPLIAGVLVNRLHKNMLLQIDPTVIYGMGKQYQGKIYQSNLRQESVYNTYIHKGLPPTPIAMPGMSSINAALHPTQHHYLYFVAIGNGSHQFSETLAKHHEAVVTNSKHSSGYYFNTAKVKAHLYRHFKFN